MHIIKGHYSNNSGDLTFGRLNVEVNDGKARFADTGAALIARRYKVCDDITGVEITGPSVGFVFLPDEGECERIGMPIAE